MSFSNNIKALRHRQDMTQDELAEALGLTSQAVSRWETGSSMPDTATITRLAYLFNVTTDFLLDVDTTKTETKIEEILSKAKELPLDEAISALRTELSQYPRHLTLMNALSGYLSRQADHLDEENNRDKKRLLTEAMELAEYVLAHSLDTDQRNGAIYNLLGIYRELGEREKGNALVETLGDYAMVRQKMRIELAEGEEKIRLSMENLHSLLSQVQWQAYMLSLESCFTRQEKIALLENAYSAAKTLLPDDEPYFYTSEPTHIPWQLAKHYSMLGDADSAMHWLNVMKEACVRADSFTGERSFILNSVGFSSSNLKSTGFGLKKYGGSWGTDWLLDLMGDEYFDNIRQDERFIAMKAEMESVQSL